MVQRRENSGFALEAAEAVPLGSPCIRQGLERDIAIEPDVPGSVDVAHPARTDEAANLVRTESDTSGEYHAGFRV